MGVKRLKMCSGPCSQERFISEFWRDSKQPDGYMSRCIDCTKQAREERAVAKEQGRPLPTVTEELRLERSERARRLHEQGRLGGREYGRLGGRPRKVRIADAVLEHFRRDPMVDLIVRAYESNLRAHSKPQRLRAAEALVAMEARNDEVLAKLRGAGKNPADLSPEELQEVLEQGIAGMIERGELDTSVFDAPPSSVRDVA